MKSEKYFLVSDSVRNNAIARINDMPVDGSVKVVISNAASKSAKQRGLQWQWYSEVANAGVGGEREDTKEGVHLISKWRFAIPILQRDDDFFAELLYAWKSHHEEEPNAMLWFVANHVSTEVFTTSQMTEYLDDFQRHYSEHVNLTNPSIYGLDKRG